MTTETVSAALDTPPPTPTTNPCRSAASGPRCNAERRIGSKCQPGCKSPTPAQAHCSVCHVTFGGVSGFDAHRRTGDCVHPSTLGMVERDGVWRKPMPEDVAERLRSARGSGG